MKATAATFTMLAIAVLTAAGITLAHGPDEPDIARPAVADNARADQVAETIHPIYGRVLFEYVTSVYYTSAEMPANSDGSFGGWSASDDAGAEHSMTIYEHYIVKEARLADGSVYRSARPYETLGRVEQLIPAAVQKTGEE